MSDAHHRDNDELLRRALNAERDYAAVVRVNDSYREELIELRIRLGMPIDDLIGISSATRAAPSRPHPAAVPINRTSSAVHISAAAAAAPPSSRTNGNVYYHHHHHPYPKSSSSQASSLESDFHDSAGSSPYISTSLVTNLTSPASPPSPRAFRLPTLSYPSVPPPSLSSSFNTSPVASRRPSISMPPPPSATDIPTHEPPGRHRAASMSGDEIFTVEE